MPGKYTKCQKATAIAVLFHCIGLIGLLFFDRIFFLASTPGNLILMGILLVWTQAGKNRFFYLFLVSCFLIGIVVEMMGVRSAVLFGHYSYGAMMGFKILDTPLILGVNWFIVIYSCGSTIYLMRRGKSSTVWFIFLGALLATFYDYLMEPVAVKLGYWRWNGDGAIPLYNYICWLLISGLLLFILQISKFEKPNKFAVNLMLIQILFFLILRITLN